MQPGAFRLFIDQSASHGRGEGFSARDGLPLRSHEHSINPLAGQPHNTRRRFSRAKVFLANIENIDWTGGRRPDKMGVSSAPGMFRPQTPHSSLPS